MLVEPVPGMLVVITKKSPRSYALYQKFRNHEHVRCSCAYAKKGIFIVDDAMGDVLVLRIKGGSITVVAPIEDVEPAVES
jgi:hypothetical protein